MLLGYSLKLYRYNWRSQNMMNFWRYFRTIVCNVWASKKYQIVHFDPPQETNNRNADVRLPSVCFSYIHSSSLQYCTTVIYIQLMRCILAVFIKPRQLKIPILGTLNFTLTLLDSTPDSVTALYNNNISSESVLIACKIIFISCHLRLSLPAQIELNWYLIFP